VHDTYKKYDKKLANKLKETKRDIGYKIDDTIDDIKRSVSDKATQFSRGLKGEVPKTGSYRIKENLDEEIRNMNRQWGNVTDTKGRPIMQRSRYSDIPGVGTVKQFEYDSRPVVWNRDYYDAGKAIHRLTKKTGNKINSGITNLSNLTGSVAAAVRKAGGSGVAWITGDNGPIQVIVNKSGEIIDYVNGNSKK
jgi:hypothetical protein